MSRIGIITDSHSSITQDEADRLGIKILPMPFYIGGECYYEGKNITRNELMEKLINQEDISTSQPSPEEVMNLWDDVLEEYDNILYMPLSSGLSGSYSTAAMLAQEEKYKEKVYVVDHGRISTPLHQSILDALEMIEEGLSASEIKLKLEQAKQKMAIFIAVDDLKYLRRGGRISSGAAVAGQILNIKPILSLDIGILELYKKCRGLQKAKKTMIEDIKTIVKMPSVEGTFQQGAPFGKDIALTLDKVLEIAQSLGFETKNLDHYIGYAQYGKGEDYIGIIGHLDVVPTGLGWKHPPFSAYEEDGYIYSRGILDNKGPIMTCLYALYAIKELNIKLHKPVRIIFGCDEETGFKDLEYYLKHEKPPVMGWTPDCKYPVVYAERGRAVIEISAKEKQVDEFFLFINNYFLNANTNAEKLGLDFKDEEFGINEMRNFVLKHEKSKLVFSVTFSYPANMTLETIVETIREKAKNMEVTCVQHYFPVKFEKDCPMVSLLSKAYEKITHLDGTPVTTTGGTYAKLMPHIVPFGPSFPGQKGIGHQPNEWMKIEDLNTNAKIYALGIYYLGML